MSNADQVELFLRLMVAAAAGAMIGLEREFRGHEAGIRTTAMVCLGSAIFAELSQFIGDSRVAAGVVQGIGFLGAGLIYQKDNSTQGVTTAATVWVTAAVGLVIGNDLMVTGILLALSLIVMLELAPVSDWVYATGRARRKRTGVREPGEPYVDPE